MNGGSRLRGLGLRVQNKGWPRGARIRRDYKKIRRGTPSGIRTWGKLVETKRLADSSRGFPPTGLVRTGVSNHGVPLRILGTHGISLLIILISTCFE